MLLGMYPITCVILNASVIGFAKSVTIIIKAIANIVEAKTTMNKKKHISEKVKTAREHRELTQLELAQKSGLNLAHIGALEQGRITAPRADTLQRICEATRIKMDWMVRGVDFITEKQRE